MVDKLYHGVNPRSSLRSITCFIVEIQRFVCDHATRPISRNYGLNALLCTCMAFPHTTRDPDLNKMDMGGAVRNERKDRARVEFRC